SPSWRAWSGRAGPRTPWRRIRPSRSTRRWSASRRPTPNPRPGRGRCAASSRRREEGGQPLACRDHGMAAIANRRPSSGSGRAGGTREPYTLGVDIGVTNIKASVLDRNGALQAHEDFVIAPHPAAQRAFLAAIPQRGGLVPASNLIAVVFPGVVKGVMVM